MIVLPHFRTKVLYPAHVGFAADTDHCFGDSKFHNHEHLAWIPVQSWNNSPTGKSQKQNANYTYDTFVSMQATQYYTYGHYA